MALRWPTLADRVATSRGTAFRTQQGHSRSSPGPAKFEQAWSQGHAQPDAIALALGPTPDRVRVLREGAKESGDKMPPCW